MLERVVVRDGQMTDMMLKCFTIRTAVPTGEVMDLYYDNGLAYHCKVIHKPGKELMIYGVFDCSDHYFVADHDMTGYQFYRIEKDSLKITSVDAQLSY